MRITLYTHYTNEEHDCKLEGPNKVLIQVYGDHLADLSTGEVWVEADQVEGMVQKLRRAEGVKVVSAYNPRAELVGSYEIEGQKTDAWRDRRITYAYKGRVETGGRDGGSYADIWDRTDSWDLDKIMESQTPKERADEMVEQAQKRVARQKQMVGSFLGFNPAGGPPPPNDDDSNVN